MLEAHKPAFVTRALAIGLATTAILAASPSAHAVPVVDGVVNAGEYTTGLGGVFNPAAPESNFANPSFQARVGYSVFQASANGFYYGAVKVVTGNPVYGPAGIVGTFSNLYFDLDPTVSPGSDLGFEIGLNGQTAFVPGIGAPVAISGITVVADSTGTTLEYAIPISYFTGPIAGLSYDPALTRFPAAGDAITLRLSQAFNYSVIGGAGYGPNRLGSITLTAAATDIPEPMSIALLGAGLIGLGLRKAARNRNTLSAT